MDDLSDLQFENAYFQMIDVSEKSSTYRRAIAQGKIFIGSHAMQCIKKKQITKGDPLTLGQIAGISAAKTAFTIIPLCHPLTLDNVAIKVTLDEKKQIVNVFCIVKAYAKTGVEMEALTGVNVALLTIYDLVKTVEPALQIMDVRLIIKEGGKKNRWIHPEGIPHEIEQLVYQVKQTELLKGMTTAIITLSDSRGLNNDESGRTLRKLLRKLGSQVIQSKIIADNEKQLIQEIKQLVETHSLQFIFTTGGTGISPRDITPEALNKVCDRIVPGLGELLRHDSACYTKFAWLSRCIVGTYKQTLIIALPGSPKAIEESIEILKSLLPHAIHIIKGGKHDTISNSAKAYL